MAFAEQRGGPREAEQRRINEVSFSKGGLKSIDVSKLTFQM